MSTKQEFLDSMQLLNKALNIADKCQPTLMEFLVSQPKSLDEMDTLDWIGVEQTVRMIMKPVQEKLQALLDDTFFKEVAAEPSLYVPGLVVPDTYPSEIVR
jgi:hypothetical protein